MTLQQLRDLVAVVTHGGYRSAARALGLSQAGLTKSIAKLEQEHGVALLDRRSKGIALTAEGEVFLRHAQAIVREADRAEAWLTASRGPRQESIALGVSIEPSLHLVPAVLADFRRLLPGVTLRLTHGVSSVLIAGVRENRLEFCVTRLPADFEASDLQVQTLFESQAVIAARADHPLAIAAPAAAPPDLASWPWVVVGDTTQSAEADPSIRELFGNTTSLPRIAALTDSLFDTVSMLLASDCLARLPKASLDHPLVAGKLAAIALCEPLQPYQIAIVRQASRHLSHEASTLAAMLASFARIAVARTPF